MEFLKKVIEMIDKPITYVIGLIVASFNVTYEAGIIADVTLMVIAISVAMLVDFIFANVAIYFTGVKRESGLMNKTVKKFVAALFVIMVFAILLVLTNSFNPLLSKTLYGIAWSFSTLIISKELVSLFETAELMGLPIPSSIKKAVLNIPNMVNKKGGDKNE